MKILAELREQGRGQDMQALVEHLPYARFLGISVDRKGNEITTILPFSDHLVGNVRLRALHGGDDVRQGGFLAGGGHAHDKAAIQIHRPGEKFAAGKIHVDLTTGQAGTELSDQINWWVRRIYLVLIFGTIGGMFIHNLLLFLRKVAARYRVAVRPVMRMSRAQRWQHFALAASFIILAITGFALKFPDSWLARVMGSSEPFRRWTHRIAGIVLLLVGLWHLIYLLSSKEGRRLVLDLFPVKKDLADVGCQIRYLLGWSPEKPKIGRFGYAEKMVYWAVVWGTIIMGASGLMIWFKMDVTRFLPRWAVDVCTTIHYYEAILACLAIVVWHFYHVIFDPDVYPLNWACWNGKVTKHWQEEEHPLEQATLAVPTNHRGDTAHGLRVGACHDDAPTGRHQASSNQHQATSRDSCDKANVCWYTCIAIRSTWRFSASVSLLAFFRLSPLTRRTQAGS